MKEPIVYKKVIRRIFALLLPEERGSLLWTIGRGFLGVFVDFMSLASLLPVLYFMLEKEESQRMTLLFLSLAGGMMVVKYFIITSIAKHQFRFSIEVYRRLSFDLYNSFYRKGLLFIRKKGVNRLNYEVNSICFAFCGGLLSPLIGIITDTLLILSMLGVFFLYEPITALLLIVSFTPIVLFYLLIVREKVSQYGEKIINAKREKWHITSETFEGFMETQVYGGFEHFSSSFLEQIEEVRRNRFKMIPYSRIPLLLSEFSVIAGLLVLSFLHTENRIVWIGVFGIAAFRLLPAVRSILSSWTQIQNASPCLQILEEGLSGDCIFQENKSNSPCTENTSYFNDNHTLFFEETISFSHIDYTYPEGEEVFRDFSCSIRRGEYVGFQGESGAGKSTLFNLLLGFIHPDAGEIKIDERILCRENRASWLRSVGYVPQEVFIFSGTLEENIAFGCKEKDRERVLWSIKKVHLEKWVSSLPLGVGTILNDKGCNCSGGQRQRIGIARALYKDVDTILLDEATSSLDNETEESINLSLQELRKENPKITILSIAHRESSLRYCDRIVHIE